MAKEQQCGYRPERSRVVIQAEEIKLPINEKEEDWKGSGDKKLLDRVDIEELTTEVKPSKVPRRFYLDSPEIWALSGIEHNLGVRDFKPKPFKRYTVPLRIRKEVQEELNRLIDLDIIEISNAQFSSPRFCITKMKKKARIVVDYWEVNNSTIPDNCQFPAISDILSDLSDAKTFSVIELNSGYHKLILDKESRKFTSFNILNQQLHYKRRPLGLRNAPKMFRRSMNQILGHLSFCQIYLGDILIVSADEEPHLEHVKEVLKILKSNNVTINTEKSKFLCNEVKYSGHILTKEGIKPDVGSLECFQGNPAPKTRRQLRSLIGTISWFRPFLKNASSQMAFLNEYPEDESKNF